MSVVAPIPERTRAQRMSALVQANDVRCKRAKLKRKLAQGERTVADVLRNVPPEAVSWPMGELLVTQHRWGRCRARKLLARAQVGEMRSVGALTERQRRELVGMLEAA